MVDKQKLWQTNTKTVDQKKKRQTKKRSGRPNKKGVDQKKKGRQLKKWQTVANEQDANTLTFPVNSARDFEKQNFDIPHGDQ